MPDNTDNTDNTDTTDTTDNNANNNNGADNNEPTTPTGTSASTANTLVNINTASVDRVGVFTTAQSLTTFPGATSAVTTIWVVLGNINGTWGKTNKIIPIALSLAVGLFIYLLSVSRGLTWKEKLSGFGIALINSFTIAAAALGINYDGSSGTPPSTP
ncbi:MAG: hypothetical protein ACKVZH_28610 [Blastocatellia bacterium]